MASFWVRLSRAALMLLSEQGGGYSVRAVLQGALSCVPIQISALTVNL